MAKLISKTYGEALLELAKEEGKLDFFFEEVKALRRVLLDYPELNTLLNHPKVARE